MASVVLVSVAKGGNIGLAPIQNKMHNVVPGFPQSPPTIIWYTNARNFRYDDYLAILAFNLLSYVVGVVALLATFFGWGGRN